MKFLSFLAKILDYIYYRKCYICSNKCCEISLCNDCWDKIFSNLSFHKAQKFNTKIYSGAPYEGILLKIIRALKYHKKCEFKTILSEIIIEIIKNYEINTSDFIICPVPIHENRLKKRKYNHMELVAIELSKHFKIEYRSDLLKRIKDTEPLYKLSVPARKAAITGAFIASDEIKGKKILLIDDIVTSGATICELSKIIQEKMPADFIVITATRSNNCNF